MEKNSPLIIDSIILDLNGTLSVRRKIVEGVAERIAKLRNRAFNLFLFTGDTNGDGAQIATQLGLELRVTKDGKAKAAEAMKIDPQRCAAIGNGKIDKLLFQSVQLGVAVLQGEGLHVDALKSAKIFFPSINDALDFFLDEKSVVATMRH